VACFPENGRREQVMGDLVLTMDELELPSLQA
jgi:hypothetical protein